MALHRRVRSTSPFLGILALLLGAAVWISLVAAGSASSIVEPEVRNRILREGRLRVIVELRLPGGAHVPEGLLTGAGQSAQRRDIASVRLQVLSRLMGRNHSVVQQYSTVPMVALEIGPDALTELEASGLWVRRVVVDMLNAPSLPQSIPLIGADQDWSLGFDGTGMIVAIVDTGVESTHPFLAGKVVEEACYSSNVTGHSTTMCPNGSTQQTGTGAGMTCPLSACWHGTHVAGIAAGNGAGASVAFSGVAKNAQIMAVQVFSKFTNASDCGGSAPCALAWTSDIIAGLERVYSLRGSRIFSSVNLSLGGGSYTAPCDSDPTKPIIDNLRSAGIATVVAAGNDGYTNALNSPGCISSAISVGATTKDDAVASFSNSASFLSLLAPGVSIYSSVTGGGFAYASGTSMATPHVTGTWAVLKQAAPLASVDQILSALWTTGLPITDADSGIAKPRIRIDRALATLVPTVTSVSPNQGMPGAAVMATISGSGFAAGAAVNAGTGITVSNVVVVSATQLTATLTISATAAVGARNVSVTNPGGGTGTLSGGFMVATGGGAGASVSVTSIVPNQGAPGTSIPVTISGSGFASGVTVSAGAGIMVVNVTVRSTTELTATLTIASGAVPGARDITVANSGGNGGTLAGGFAVLASVTVSSISPNQGTQGGTVSVTIGGAGFMAGASVSFSGTGVTVSNVSVGSSTQLTGTFVIASGAAVGARDVTVTNPSGGNATLTGGFIVVSSIPATLSVAYNGKAQDRVGQGETALGADGAPDGTLTVTLNGSGGRTVTGLVLASNWPTWPGTWRTSSPGTGNWVLGVAATQTGPLLNAPGTTAVNFAVADGGSFVVFAADYLGGEFAPGNVLAVTATFSDGSTATASTSVN